ncbi:hypothetical protein [Kaarinaea lacus]
MTENIVDRSDKKIIKLAEPMLQNLLDGSNELNYEKFSRDFSHGMKTVMPHEMFMEQSVGIRQVRGKCVSRKALGVLRKNKTALVVWSAQYEKTSDDMLIQLKLSYEDEHLVISDALIT